MTNMTVAFNTQYEGQGATQFKTGITEASGSLETLGTTAETQGIKVDSLIRRIERPLGMIAFSGIANELTGMGAKGESAMIMVEKGLHAAGNALMFFNPLLGIGVIAGTALFEALEKMGKAAHLTAEEMDKLFKANELQAKSFRDAATEAEKEGDRKDVIDSLRQQADVLDKATAHTKEKAKADMDAARAVLQHLLANRDLNKTQEQVAMSDDMNSAKLKAIANARDALTERIKAYTAVLAENASHEKDYTADIQKQTDMTLQNKIQNQDMVKTITELNGAKMLLNKTEQEIIHNTEPAKLKALEDEYDWLKKVMDLEQKHLDELKKNAADEVSVMSNLQDSLKSGLSTMVTSFQTAGTDMHKAMNSALATMVTDFCNGIAAMLMAAAIQDYTNPYTIPKAVAETAGAAAVTALGAATASALGGGGSASSSPSAGSGSTFGSATASSGGNNQNQTTLTININGGMIDKPTVAYIMQMSNVLVQQNGNSLVATHINGVSPMPGTA